MKKLFFAVFVLLFVLSAEESRLARADAVTDWNANAGKAAIAACISPANDPLHESRMYAVMHIAIHDALNAIDRRSRPYVFDTPAVAGASVDAAVSYARHDFRWLRNTAPRGGAGRIYCLAAK
jgi:hypothetical protein